MENLVAIVGLGIVGSAVRQSFLEKGVQIIEYDKYKNIGNLDSIRSAPLIFLCLPTLYDYNTNMYNKDAISETCQYLNEAKYKGIIILKSTVEPQTTEKLVDMYNLKIMHSPEFLRAKTAYEDFHQQKHIVIGTTKLCDNNDIEFVCSFFQGKYPAAHISVCSSAESECTKIFCNTFYSVKIQFFNELYLLCNKLNINFDAVKQMMLKNDCINPMYTSVPGSDGSLSYSGMCFPKDTNALLSFMIKNETPHKVLQGTISERNEMRND
jgi:nucleotide sugar dehydrogenase